MQACEIQLAHLKNILVDYATSTGLKINFHKSNLEPINITAQRAKDLVAIFGCTVAQMPFTYLGLPMGTTKPTVTDLLPLVDRIERKVTTATILMSYAGKLAYVNAILSSIAMYTMCSIEINPKTMEQIEKIRRRCLWEKKTDDGSDKCFSLAAWEMVCKPKNKGGLGIIHMKTQNQALLLKYLDKFYNKKDLQWVNLIWNTYYQNSIPHATDSCGSFWWKSIMKLSPVFRGVAECSVGKGNSVLLWKDNWSHGIMQHNYPCLFSYAINEDISVAEITDSTDLIDLFHLPISPEAFTEWEQLQAVVNDGSRDTLVEDKWRYKWGDKFTAKKYYNFCFRNITPPAPFLWIWKAKIWPKLKFFAWLLLADRLNTRNMLKRRHINIGNIFTCPLCNSGEEETVEHLFFKCTFSLACWTRLNIIWPAEDNTIEIITQARSMHHGPLFFEKFIIGAWGIWKERNSLIFRNIRPTRVSWRGRVCSDLLLLRFKVPETLSEHILDLIDTI
jgi:hypothetical protein